MKKIIFALLLLVMFACTKEGEITDQSSKHIIINGKEYRFIKVVPSNGASAVWLLIPNDAKVEIPQVTAHSYTTSCGKNCHRTVHVECLWIKS